MFALHRLALRHLHGLGWLGCVFWVLLALGDAVLIDDPVCLVVVAIFSSLLVEDVDEDEDDEAGKDAHAEGDKSSWDLTALVVDVFGDEGAVGSSVGAWWLVDCSHDGWEDTAEEALNAEEEEGAVWPEGIDSPSLLDVVEGHL